MTSPIRAYIDALVHPSARSDPLAAARHRVFIGTRLAGVLVVFALLPVLLASRGVPTALEALAFVWCLSPLIAVWDIARNGAYDRAHLISVITVGSLIATIASVTGGIYSFATPWLVILPLGSAVGASRRVAWAATLIALFITLALWAAGTVGWLPSAEPAGTPTLHLLGVISAVLYAAGVGLGAGALTRLSEQTKLVGEARYQMFAQNMTDMITRHGKNGAVTFVSPAAEQLFDVPVSQLLGHGLFDRVHVSDRPAFLTALADAAAAGTEASVEYRVRCGLLVAPEGLPAPAKYVWMETRCRLMKEQRGRNKGELEVVAVTRDISQRKSDEFALESARSEAQRANDAKSRFLATVSHELRTPLNAIIGFSEMLMHEQDLSLDAARRQDYARLIRDSGEHLLAVVNGILDVTRIESGHFVIVPEPFAIAPLLETCHGMMALRAEQAGVQLVTECSELPEIVADKRALRQVLINLLSNAIKFTDRGGVVTMSARLQGETVVLEVSDNGIGIADKDLARLGHPFFQASSSYDRPYEGTGLGLSVVKGLVELHGGRVEIGSRLGEGTRVTVRLPLDCERAATRRAVIEALPTRPIAIEPPRVKRSA